MPKVSATGLKPITYGLYNISTAFDYKLKGTGPPIWSVPVHIPGGTVYFGHMHAASTGITFGPTCCRVPCVMPTDQTINTRTTSNLCGYVVLDLIISIDRIYVDLRIRAHLLRMRGLPLTQLQHRKAH